jgi:drug/metabolite transporter, DME family
MADERAATRGRLLVVAAAVLWSLSGFFVKSPWLADLPAATAGPTIACYRCIFATVILLPFVRPARFRWHWVLIPMVLSFASMNLLLIWSMTLTTAGNAILLQYTAPLWMFLASVTLLGERADRRNLAALALGMVGIGVILVAFMGGSEMIGVLMGLGAGASYAAVVICVRVLREHDPYVLVALNHGVSALVLLPWLLAVAPQLPATDTLLALAAFGLVQMAVPYVVFTRGMQTVSPQEAGVITLLEPIINPLWVFLAWGEPLAPATLIGGAFILSGLAVRYMPWRRA